MADTLTWLIWPDFPWLSLATWVVLGVALATLVRPVVLQATYRIFRVLRYTLARIAARIQTLANRIQARNERMWLVLGRGYLERQIQRQSLQLQQALDNDLSQVEPQGSQLRSLIERMEDDYDATREPVRETPEWFRAAESLLETKAAHAGNRTLQHLLEQLHVRVRSESLQARQDYRQAIAERHQLLNQFLPYWRRLLRMQGDIGQGVQRIEQRAVRLEALLERYESMTSDSGGSMRSAVGSVLVHFLVAAVVMLAVAILATASFWSFSAGTTLLLPQVSTGNIMVLSLALACGQILTGMVLLENMQVTRLFRSFWVVDSQTATQLRWAALVGMVLWSVLNGALAWLAALEAWTEVAPPNGVILVRVLLAALTPWILMLFVIPLEPLLNGVRIIGGQAVVLLVWTLAWVLRLAHMLVRLVEQLWIGAYELVCAPLRQPILLLRRSSSAAKSPGATNADQDPETVRKKQQKS